MFNKLFSVSHCSNIIPQLVIDKKISNNNNNYSYSTTYLCVKKEKINFYHFIKFSSFSNADKYCKENYNGKIEDPKILSVCKFIPSYFHTYILNYKLYKLKINN
jgi:hypothetical protein